VEVNVKEALKINKDKMMLAKIESWEQKKNIMLNKSKLKERKGKIMYSYIDDDLTNEERKIQNSGVTLGFYFGTGSKSSDLNEIFLMCYK
jgi:hypothetical protein